MRSCSRTPQPGQQNRAGIAPIPGSTQAAGSLVFQGTVHGSDESFAAETLSDAQKRFPLVRTSVGQSRNMRNNSIYDRHFDWLLTGPSDGQTTIAPSRKGSGPVDFAVECKGKDFTLVFRPHYYQRHRGLKHFTPWTYKVRQDSITGWCSWWAYMGSFDEKTLKSLLAVWRERHMGDYGYHLSRSTNATSEEPACLRIGFTGTIISRLA